MNEEQQKEGLTAIEEMIHELAKGNFSYRLPSTLEGEFSELSFLLNLLAEELSGFFVPSHLLDDQAFPYSFLFVLDTNYCIRGVNEAFSGLLGQSREAIVGRTIAEFLDPYSFQQLEQAFTQFTKEEGVVPLIRLLLTFRTPISRIESWGYCHVLSGLKGQYYFIRGTQLFVTDLSTEHRPQASIPLKSGTSVLQLRLDIEKIRKVYQYILAHLHEPLPSLSTLARRFLVNEYKLKKGFKALYHTTIFKLHLEKRLTQALVMIQNSPTSLKVIAHSLGFKSYPHFSKVFKDKYGHPPSYYR